MNTLELVKFQYKQRTHFNKIKLFEKYQEMPGIKPENITTSELNEHEDWAKVSSDLSEEEPPIAQELPKLTSIPPRSIIKVENAPENEIQEVEPSEKSTKLEGKYSNIESEKKKTFKKCKKIWKKTKTIAKELKSQTKEFTFQKYQGMENWAKKNKQPLKKSFKLLAILLIIATYTLLILGASIKITKVKLQNHQPGKVHQITHNMRQLWNSQKSLEEAQRDANRQGFAIHKLYNNLIKANTDLENHVKENNRKNSMNWENLKNQMSRELHQLNVADNQIIHHYKQLKLKIEQLEANFATQQYKLKQQEEKIRALESVILVQKNNQEKVLTKTNTEPKLAKKVSSGLIFEDEPNMEQVIQGEKAKKEGDIDTSYSYSFKNKKRQNKSGSNIPNKNTTTSSTTSKNNQRLTLTKANFKQLDKPLDQIINSKLQFNSEIGEDPKLRRVMQRLLMNFDDNFQIEELMLQLPKIRMLSSSKVNRRANPTYFDNVINHKWHTYIDRYTNGLLISQKMGDFYEGWNVYVGPNGRIFKIFEWSNNQKAGFERVIDLRRGSVTDYDHNKGQMINRWSIF